MSNIKKFADFINESINEEFTYADVLSSATDGAKYNSPEYKEAEDAEEKIIAPVMKYLKVRSLKDMIQVGDEMDSGSDDFIKSKDIKLKGGVFSELMYNSTNEVQLGKYKGKPAALFIGMDGQVQIFVKK